MSLQIIHDRIQDIARNCARHAGAHGASAAVKRGCELAVVQRVREVDIERSARQLIEIADLRTEPRSHRRRLRAPNKSGPPQRTRRDEVRAVRVGVLSFHSAETDLDLQLWIFHIAQCIGCVASQRVPFPTALESTSGSPPSVSQMCNSTRPRALEIARYKSDKRRRS